MDLVSLFGWAAVCYFVLALGLWFGSPHLYKRNMRPIWAEVRTIMPFVFIAGLPLAAYAYSDRPLYLGLCGVACCYGAIRIRGFVFAATKGPRSWLFHPITVMWPMFVFDVWTILGAVLWSSVQYM